MDRPFVYSGALPQATDLLVTNRNAMIALGYMLQAAFGTGVVVDVGAHAKPSTTTPVPNAACSM